MRLLFDFIKVPEVSNCTKPICEYIKFIDNNMN
jgi:hypothetical protein